MPATPKDIAVKQTTDGKGRVTVQLPPDTAEALTRIGALMSDQLFAVTRVRIDISRPDVIRSLAATFEAVQEEAAAEAAIEAATTPEGGGES